MEPKLAFKRIFRLKNYYLLSLLLFLLVHSVSAVNCDADLNIGVSGHINNTCDVVSSLTLNGTYIINMNGSGSLTGDGAIRINGDNLVFDGNGTIIIGNGSSSAITKLTANRENITIKNLIFIEMPRGVFLRNLNNITLTNITIINTTDIGFLMRNATNATLIGNRLIGNSSLGSTGIFFDTSGNYNSIMDNNFTGLKVGIQVSDNQNTTIYRNLIINSTIEGSANGIYLLRANNTNVSFNNISFMSHNGIDIDSYSNTISFNSISYVNHHGIDLVSGSSDITASGGYNSIFNNSILNSNNTGIYIQTAFRNLLFNNIIFNIFGDSDNSGIAISGSANSSYGNSVYNNTIINSSEGLFDGSVDNVYFDNYIISSRDYEIELTRANIDPYSIANSTIGTNFYVNSTFVRIKVSSPNMTDIFNKSSPDSYLFNRTSLNGTSIIQFKGAINSLIYNSNGTVECVSLSSCTGNFNISISGSNFTYVLNNFNLTEGISRQFSPLAFTASSSTSKSIQSNLTQTINATVVFDIDTTLTTASCDLIRTLKYTPFGGTQISPTYSCDNNTKQVTTTVTINPTVGNQANQFELTFLDSQIIACDALTSSFANSATLVGLLVAVIFLSVIIALLFTAFTEGLSPATLDSLGRNILMASAIGILIVSFIYIIATTGGC